jgi:hypothetical protein
MTGMMSPRLLLALGMALGGCASLPEQTVRFQGLSDCPSQTPRALLSQQGNIGPGSSTHALQCALTVARETRDPVLLGTDLPARLALHLAERSQDSQTREALANEGVRLAQQALKQGGAENGGVHYYLAANLGLAIHDHPLQAADQISTLERELQKAIQLSSTVDDGGPLRLLGMLYLKAPPWPTGIGDGDKALELLNGAVDKFPDHPLNHLFLAQALWEVEDNARMARQQWNLGLEKLNKGPWGYNRAIWNHEFQTVAQELDEPAR